MLKFYSHLDGGGGYMTMSHLLRKIAGMVEVGDPSRANIIVFNGGEDIATEIYGENSMSYGRIPQFRSYRDIEEIKLFDTYKGSKFFLGICRGAQLLNCLNGGKLYQHVNGHEGTHDMIDLDSNKVYRATSTHHQQMRPSEKHGDVVAVASCSTLKLAENLRESCKTTHDLRQGLDVEIMWYNNTRSLCMQFHPEYVPGSELAQYSIDLIRHFYREKISA